MLATRKVGDTLTLFTAPSGTELTSETISVEAGSRYTVEISSNTVTATVKTPSNFVHYDFAEGAGQASDTTYTHGDYTSYARNNARNGKALAVNSSSGTPYHSSNSAGKSPFHAGEMSILSLVKPYEADGTILWNLGQAAGGRHRTCRNRFFHAFPRLLDGRRNRQQSSLRLRTRLDW